MRIPLALGLLALVSSPCFAETIWVPDDHATIQAAIGAAAEGDEIVVRPGVYYENLDYLGKDVVLRSEAGPEVTTIDGRELTRVVQFQSGETAAAVLAGFTITHGRAETGNGGGIDCTLQSSPTIRDCLIVDNYAYGLGGGIACRGFSDALILRCTFIGNWCPGGYEGGQGGGLSCFLSSPTVIDCVFDSNHAKWGGGIDFSGSFSVVANCLFVDNHAYIGGGAAYCSMADPKLLNCTMVSNSAAVGGALVTAGAVLPSHPVLTNCILWNDTPQEIVNGIGTVTAEYCDVQGGWPGVENINEDPLFVDAGRGDFRLQQDPPQSGVFNPCVDAGDPLSTPIPGSTRTDWVLDSGRADLGYHFAVPTASATFRNPDVGGAVNPAVYHVSALPVLGTSFTARIEPLDGHDGAFLVGFSAPLTLAVEWGNVLVDFTDAQGELTGFPAALGDPAVLQLPIPGDPALYGFRCSTQAVRFGGGIDLTNAQDLVLGQ